jgi:hypothetical protein
MSLLRDTVSRTTLRSPHISKVPYFSFYRSVELTSFANVFLSGTKSVSVQKSEESW